MPWFLWVYFVLTFLALIALSWPMVSSRWWDTNMDWIESNQRRFNFFTKEDERLSRLFRDVLQRSKEKGFPEYPVILRKVRSFVWTTYDGLARNNTIRKDKNKIYIFERATRGYSDDDLRVLLAHEWGHILDGVTKRTGHPVFARVKRFDSEEFADFIAAYLYSKEMLFDTARRCKYDGRSLDKLNNIEITRTF